MRMLPCRYVFDQLSERKAEDIRIEVTYLEIYNDSAYDLLNAASGGNARLPKVTVQDNGKQCTIRDLTVHPATTEETATNLLFVGKTNRTVAKTSMNLQSSRSHSIFTIYMTCRKPDSDTIVRSKLNLVDLAGSERIGKSGAQGKQLTEAKHINLSLHYLEAVIVSLQHSQRKRHIPYRNSLLTKVLRDSLGGNCLTAMVATISSKTSNKYESISTCRFAQRVAMVDNKVQKNEILDDKTLIKQLRRKIAELTAELQLAYAMRGTVQEGEGATPVGGASSSPTRGNELSSEERAKCRQIMHKFIKGGVRDPLQACEGNAGSMRVCFDMLRAIVLEYQSQAKEMHDTLQAGERNTEELHRLQRKYGVSQAKLRNMEISTTVPSGYGSKSGWKRNQGGGRSGNSTPASRGGGSRGGGASGGAAAATGLGGYGQQPRKKKPPPEEEDPRLKLARQRAAEKLVQLIIAEDDTVLVLQEITERLLAQRAMAERAAKTSPQDAHIYMQRAQQLETEQHVLGQQLEELRRVRAQLEKQVNQQFNVDTKRKVGTGTSGASKKPTSSQSSRSTHSGSRGKGGAVSRSTVVRSNTSIGFDAQQRKAGRAPASRGTGGGPATSMARARTMDAAGPAHRSAPNTAATFSPKREKSIKNHEQELERREQATREKLRAMKQQLIRQQTAAFEKVAAGGVEPGQAEPAAARASRPASNRSTDSTASARRRAWAKEQERSNIGSPDMATPPATRKPTAADRSSRSRGGVSESGASSRAGSTTPQRATPLKQPAPQRSTPRMPASMRWEVDDQDDSSDADEPEPAPTRKFLPKPAPAAKQKIYKSALAQQRDRIQKIRESIRAAIVIQRSWRAHKQRGRRR